MQLMPGPLNSGGALPREERGPRRLCREAGLELHPEGTRLQTSWVEEKIDPFVHKLLLNYPNSSVPFTSCWDVDW